MEIYFESNLLRFKREVKPNVDFSRLGETLLSEAGGKINGFMLYEKVNEEDVLFYVFHKGKKIKKGELTINILKDVQYKQGNRNDNDLVALVNNFNLVNE